MKAKEKAKDLCDKFCEYSHTDFDRIRGGYQFISQIENAKQCALIAVDEILSIELLNDTLDDYYLRYWQEVKQEILTYGGNK
jgi:hypothetical protein